MPIEALRQELQRIGQLMNYWQAELGMALCGGAALALLWLAGVSDVLLHFGMVTRVAMWLLMLGAFGAGCWRVYQALSTSRTLEAIAARIEQTFPQLDNHLINVVQFAGVPSSDRIRNMYVRQGVPQWNEVKVKELKDRRTHQRIYIALSAVALLLLAPFFWMSESWGNALARILNPFSSRPASTLAHIREVTPGNAAITGGNAVTITVKAEGKAGQPVTIDLWPSDDKTSSVKLGSLAGQGVEEFTFPIPKLAANLTYRAQAGDETSAKYLLRVQAPLSISRLDVTIVPRKDSGAAESHVDGLTDQLLVPQGADLAFTLNCNRPLTKALMAASRASVTMTSADNGKTWTGTMRAASAGTLIVTGFGVADEKVTTNLKLQLVPDQPPVIKIIAPAGRTTLSAGAVPALQWIATDDFGLTRVTVEQGTVTDQQDADAVPAETTGQVLKEWPLTNARSFAQTWKGDGLFPMAGKPITLRVVAYDNFGPGEPHKTQSPWIVFETATAKEVAEGNTKSNDHAEASLSHLIELQTKNLVHTRELQAGLKSTNAQQWKEVSSVQKEIRRVTGILLADPKRPLGELHQRILPFYQDKMQQVILALESIPSAEETNKRALTISAVSMEMVILDALSATQTALPGAQKDKKITDLLSAMDALVKGQAEVVQTILTNIARAINLDELLLKKEDRLSGDVDQFVDSARQESEALKRSDANFATLIAKVTSEIAARHVSADMLKASEQIEDKAPDKAQPLAASALSNLKELQTMLNAWRVEAEKKGLAARKEEEAAKMVKIAKIKKLEARLADAMKQLALNRDQTTPDEELRREEVRKMKEDLKEAELKIATDLHIFQDMDYGDGMINELNTRFDKSEQEKGSEKKYNGEVGTEKDDRLEDGMADVEPLAGHSFDFTLATTPNLSKIDEEAFDQKEMVDNHNLPPLLSDSNDLVGDLLDQQEDLEKKTDGSATNQATLDDTEDGVVAEGQYADYSAKGKTGNIRPQHNEGTGRATIGREGQSDGGTAQNAGKIREGDNNVEKRMTNDAEQSGQVDKVDDSLAKARATGGGKMSGTADGAGMAGQGARRDANARGTMKGLQALLTKNADALYAKASLQHVRTGSLDEAVRHMRSADEAIRQGRPLQEVREFQRQATDALRRTQVELSGGVTTQSAEANASTASPVPDQMAGTVDEAPANYQGMVSDYYKAISTAPH